jgi:Na+/H+-dicarboxylate symporter
MTLVCPKHRNSRVTLRFVVPLGATINMDGAPLLSACIWLAVLNGIEPNVAHYLLVIIATVGSAGTAPRTLFWIGLDCHRVQHVFGTTGIP